MTDPLLPKNALGSSWPTETLIPQGFLPMLASPASGPLDSLEHAYEVKWEGLRVLAGLEGPRLVVRTGTGQDGRFWFPELQSLRAAAEPNWVLLDGEIVQFQDDRLSPSGLQSRLHATDPAAVGRLRESNPITFLVYDILRIGDSWLLDVAWDERRDILQRAIQESPGIRLSPCYPDGQAALEHARGFGLESVIAKRLRGRYVPGQKTRDWLSIRCLEVVETVICGWTEGRGARAGTIGSLLLAQWRGGQLTYVGHTGTGLDAQTLHDLHGALMARGRRTCPLAEAPALPSEAHWVEPTLGCRVRVQGWTDRGHLRGPTFVELIDPVAVAS